MNLIELTLVGWVNARIDSLSQKTQKNVSLIHLRLGLEYTNTKCETKLNYACECESLDMKYH